MRAADHQVLDCFSIARGGGADCFAGQRLFKRALDGGIEAGLGLLADDDAELAGLLLEHAMRRL